MRAAYLVLLADDRIAGEERKKLKDIAAALQISGDLFRRDPRGLRHPGSRSRSATSPA